MPWAWGREATGGCRSTGNEASTRCDGRDSPVRGGEMNQRACDVRHGIPWLAGSLHPRLDFVSPLHHHGGAPPDDSARPPRPCTYARHDTFSGTQSRPRCFFFGSLSAFPGHDHVNRGDGAGGPRPGDEVKACHHLNLIRGVRPSISFGPAHFPFSV
jgi:hypothetical protein